MYLSLVLKTSLYRYHTTHIFIVTFIITFSKTRVERSDHTIHVMERGWVELMASNANTEEGI